MVRREKAAVLSQLPAKTRQTVPVDVPPRERTAIERRLAAIKQASDAAGDGDGGGGQHNPLLTEVYGLTGEAKVSHRRALPSPPHPRAHAPPHAALPAPLLTRCPYLAALAAPPLPRRTPTPAFTTCPSFSHRWLPSLHMSRRCSAPLTTSSSFSLLTTRPCWIGSMRRSLRGPKPSEHSCASMARRRPRTASHGWGACTLPLLTHVPHWHTPRAPSRSLSDRRPPARSHQRQRPSQPTRRPALTRPPALPRSFPPAQVARFQREPGVRVALLSINAAGVGLTLTAATLVVFAELSWNASFLVQVALHRRALSRASPSPSPSPSPSLFALAYAVDLSPRARAQAEDRAHRIGQHSNVLVQYCLADGTLDDWIWRTVERKLHVTGSALNGHASTDAFAGDVPKYAGSTHAGSNLAGSSLSVASSSLAGSSAVASSRPPPPPRHGDIRSMLGVRPPDARAGVSADAATNKRPCHGPSAEAVGHEQAATGDAAYGHEVITLE